MLGVWEHPGELGLVSGTKTDIKLWALSLPLCESSTGTPSQEGWAPSDSGQAQPEKGTWSRPGSGNRFLPSSRAGFTGSGAGPPSYTHGA